MIDRLVIGLDENITIDLSASEPRYYKFEFPEGVSTVLLTVSSMDEVCTSVLVQNMTVRFL